jgi:hypothetical protein
MAPHLRVYAQYCNNFDKIASLVRNHKKNNPKFLIFIEKLQQEVKNNGGKDLNSYLILPVQRIPRYNLLLRVKQIFLFFRSL